MQFLLNLLLSPWIHAIDDALTKRVVIYNLCNGSFYSIPIKLTVRAMQGYLFNGVRLFLHHKSSPGRC